MALHAIIRAAIGAFGRTSQSPGQLSRYSLDTGIFYKDQGVEHLPVMV